MSIKPTKEQIRQLRADNAKYSSYFQEIPFNEWPYGSPPSLTQVWRNRNFLVQVHKEANSLGVSHRVTICRTEVDGNQWKDGISWEEIQTIKDAIGFADHDAVEVYPMRRDIINVANMRHLWIMPTPLLFAWRKQEKEHGQP